MLPRIRHNNFIGAVELFVKSSYTKTHSNNFFNNIQHAFRKKDWVSNYDSLLTLREFFRCATQIDKDSYQVLSSKNETVKAMDKFLISFSLKDKSFMDFKNREFPLEQNRRLYAWDILQKKQSDIPKRIKGYIHQAIGDVSLGYALLEDIVSKLKRGKFELQIPGGGIKECDGWYIYEKIIDDNFAIVIESLGFALKIYGGDERFRNGSSVVLEDEDYSLIYNFLVNAGCQQVELAEQVDAIVSANLAADSDITKEKICEKYKSTIEAFKKEQLALPVLVRCKNSET